MRLSAFYVVVGSSFVDSKFHKYAVNISVKTATTPSLYKVVTYISFVFKLGILGQHFLDCFCHGLEDRNKTHVCDPTKNPQIIICAH